MKEYSEEQQMYLINDLMREIIASHYDKIIRKIMDESSYTGIDLLGVSFGGGVSVFLTQMGTINVEQLILMAPGIQNFGNIKLKQNIILGWCIQDNKLPFKINGKKLIEEIKKIS